MAQSESGGQDVLLRDAIDCESILVDPQSILVDPHSVELEVRRRLMAESTLNFRGLVVRRMNDGVCLEGVVEADSDCVDVRDVARSVEGVRNVVNQLVFRTSAVPPKG